MSFCKSATVKQAIKVDSPMLYGHISRRFSLEEVSQLNSAYELSKSYGSTQELDFEREPGVSFNPRPARIAAILLKDTQEVPVELVEASFFACADSLSTLIRENPHIPSSTANIALSCQKGAQTLLQKLRDEPTSSHPILASRLFTTLWLDRARHLHQITTEDRKVVWKNFLQQTDVVIELAQIANPRVADYLRHWGTRFKRRLNTL